MFTHIAVVRDLVAMQYKEYQEVPQSHYFLPQRVPEIKSLDCRRHIHSTLRLRNQLQEGTRECYVTVQSSFYRRTENQIKTQAADFHSLVSQFLQHV